MTEVVLGPPTPANDAIGTGAVVEGSAPVLISEQQVMFATAAALPERHSGPASWLRGITRLFAGARNEKASADDRRKPRDAARRYSYIEDAAMAREMDRL
jgi:hypothetical protein